MKSQNRTIQKNNRLEIVDIDECTVADAKAQTMRELAKRQNMRHLGRKLKRRGHGANRKYTIPTEYVDSETPNALDLKTPEIQKMIARMD